MKFSELLSEEVILLNFSAEDKWEAIDRMLDRLEQLGRLLPGQRTPVRDALVARENIASTGLEHGVALPHATVDVLDKPVAVLAISPEGVPFQSSDGKPARLTVLIVIPRRTRGKYVRTLAGIARILNYEEMRDALSAVKSPGEALRIIEGEEAKEPGN